MDLQIIPLSPADFSSADDLATVMIDAWQSGFRGILSDSDIEKYTRFGPCADMFRQLLASRVGTMYLARLDGQAVGLLYWLPDGENARIEALLTVPEVWGKGVAPALMARMLTDAANFQCITVWPFRENHRARRFYEKHGFSPTSQSRMGNAEEAEYILANAFPFKKGAGRMRDG